MALGRAEGTIRALEAGKQQADQRVDVAAAAAVGGQARTRLIPDAAVVSVIPTRAHLHRVLTHRMRQRARDLHVGRRRRGDRIATDTADVAERRADRGHAEIGGIERPGIDAERFRIDLVVRLDRLREVIETESRFEQRPVRQSGIPDQAGQRGERRIGDRVEQVDGAG